MSLPSGARDPESDGAVRSVIPPRCPASQDKDEMGAAVGDGLAPWWHQMWGRGFWTHRPQLDWTGQAGSRERCARVQAGMLSQAACRQCAGWNHRPRLAWAPDLGDHKNPTLIPKLRSQGAVMLETAWMGVGSGMLGVVSFCHPGHPPPLPLPLDRRTAHCELQWPHVVCWFDMISNLLALI